MPTLRRTIALIGGISLISGGLAAVTTSSALAAPDGSGLVISEVYGSGANAGSNYTHDFVELYNPTDAAISVAGWSVQYRSAAGTSATVTPLAGSVAANSHYLVTMGAGAEDAVPTPDATGSAAMSGANGVVLLVPSLTPITAQGDLKDDPTVVDTVGYGSTPTTFETVNTGVALTATTAAARSAGGTDTNHNANDFTEGAPGPVACGEACDPPPPTETEATIAEIQGTEGASELVGDVVTTRGVVTA
ncbi:lamin tail domain-containing protein, partial [Nocardioides sp.]|uniref:lamin tail domain-containing protein n=1 Tax=Nocardioides sp. TaxID=35761 RepID=UPI002ED0B32A